MTTNPLKFGPEVRTEYLALLRAGHGRLWACRHLGIHPDTMRRFARASEDFRQQVADAEEEAAEPVEAKLYQAALEGEPWAVKEWLTKRSKARWGDESAKLEVTVSGTVSVEAGPGLAGVIGRVAAMQAQLEERRLALEEAGGVVDAEVIEDAPPLPALLPGPHPSP